VPGLGRLTYRVPDGQPVPPKGARVNVPIGSREVMGCVIESHALKPEGGTLRDLEEILDTEPYLPEHIVDLALWVADYYAAGPGDALAVALPPMSRRGGVTAFRTVKMVELVRQAEAAAPKGRKQQQALALLAQAPDLSRSAGRPEPGRGGLGLSVPDLQKAGVSLPTLRSLERAGLVRFRETLVERDPFQGVADNEESLWSLGDETSGTRELTDEQRQAFRHLEEAAIAGQFKAIVLQGVTGSGKTELYARLADLVLSRGRRVLVLVPEIALTPAVAGLFRARFGRRVTIQHSGLSDGERHDQWHRIRRGEVDVVVGTRSAVFAPLGNVGLIIVDEEQDGAYKQEESPRYHGRDVAVVRGRMEGAVVVLGSATPSLESAANAKSGRYDALTLTQRILNRPLAEVRIVDMREEYATEGSDVVISRALWAALENRLSLGEQSLVLLNRRGFATVIFCRQCAATLECPHCSVTLTYHRTARRVRCHYCNYSSSIPRVCGTCGGEFLEQSGFGTERIEAVIRERFPGARIVRVDRDTVRRRGAIARVLGDVARGDVDIVVGTQMIAKGHDFPAVTLAGVISADVGLGMADFRAAERTFQLLTQVVGRAGRGDIAGEALVQTLFPDHYSVKAAAAQDYAAFFDQEMEFRTRMDYPPRVGLINVIVKAKTLTQAMEHAHTLAGLVRHQGPKARIVGPAPAPLSKIKDEYRAQFFLKGKERRAMREAIQRALDHKPELKRRTMIDVDPYSVL
jgi:primosomal protein N' (replication factor Y)